MSIWKRAAAFAASVSVALSAIIIGLPKAGAVSGDQYTLRDYDYSTLSYSFDGSYPAPFGNTSQIWHEFRMQNNRTGGFSSGYCMSYGVYTSNGTVYSAMSSDQYTALSKDQKALINYALMFGYDVGILPGAEYRDVSKYIGTQIMIWMITSGQLGTSWESSIVSKLTAGNANALNYYNTLKSTITSFQKRPSFSGVNTLTAPTYTLQWNSAKNRYETSLTDTNEVLGDFSFSMSDVTFEKSGNTLTIHTTKAINTAATSSSTKAIPMSIHNCAIDFLVNGSGAQPVCTYNYDGTSDPVNAYFKIKTAAVGELEIEKDSDDNVKSGFSFQVTSDAGFDKMVTTGSNGKASLTGLPIYKEDGTTKITYTVKETSVPGRYTTPESQTVKLTNGTTTVNFTNSLRRGTLAVLKTSDDNLNGSRTFSVKGSNGYTGTMTTGKDGKASISNLPVYDSENKLIQYTVTETGTPSRYVVPSPVTVTLETNKTITANFKNSLKRGTLAVLKTSDDNLNGSRTFSVKGSNGYTGTMTTGKDGKASISNLPVYDSENKLIKYTVTETGTPDRYIVPKPVTVTLETNKTVTANFHNGLKRGNLAVLKTSDDNLNNGRTFKVTGSNGYSGTMTTGTDGRAQLANLPVYDSQNKLIQYTVTETGTPDRYIVPKPVTVTLETNKTITASFHNERKTAVAELIKLDGESSNHILNHDGVFTVYEWSDKQGGYLEHSEMTWSEADQKYVTGILTYTLDNGGKFKIIETRSPTGYYNDRKLNVELAIITGGEAFQINGGTVTNIRQKASITITKEGETLTGYDFRGTEFGTLYEPVFEIQAKENAVYELTALEDIVLPDGTLKYKAGEPVQITATELQPDGNVYAQFDNLDLGKYKVREITAPEGYFIGANEYEIELVYQGQEVEVFDTPVTSFNDRQRFRLTFQKEIEENEIHPNPEAYRDIYFGVFSREDISDEKGNILLKKDSLLEVLPVSESGQVLSKGEYTAGSYYVKELQTAEGWSLLETEYNFTLEYPAQESPLLWIDLNELYGEIKNNVIRGRFAFWKLSSFDGRILSNATYGVFAAEESEVPESGKLEQAEFPDEAEAVAILTTGEDGDAEVEDIPYGWYYLQEMGAPEHYHIDDTRYYFNVGEGGEIIDATVSDAPIIGALIAQYIPALGSEGVKGFWKPGPSKTGDQFPIWTVAAGFAAAAVTGSIIIGLRIKKKGRKKHPSGEGE